MLKHYSIPTAEDVQASLLWPIPSAHGDIAILKISIAETWRRDIRVQAIVLKAFGILGGLGDSEQGEMIVQVRVGDDVTHNLVRARHTTHWSPGLIWHRGTAENLAECLLIDMALLGPSDLPLVDAPALAPEKSYATRRYLLINDDDVQAHFDWPVPSAQGNIPIITIREPYKTSYTQRSGDLTLRAARLIFERFGVLVESMVTHTFQPKCEYSPEVWDIVAAQWHGVGRTSTPEPDGVWNFVNKAHIQASLNLTDDVLEADLPYFDAPPPMPPAREIMTPQKRIEDKVGKDADLLLDCLERISGTLEQGRSVGFQVGLSDQARQMLITRHSARAAKILANCPRLQWSTQPEPKPKRLMAIIRKALGFKPKGNAV